MTQAKNYQSAVQKNNIFTKFNYLLMGFSKKIKIYIIYGPTYFDLLSTYDKDV